MSILKNKTTWGDDLGKVFDEFYHNSNVLLNLEKPVLTLLRKALITLVKWLADEGYISVKRRSNQFGSFFKWVPDLEQSCQVMNVVVMKRQGYKAYKLQPCNPSHMNLTWISC